MCSFRHLYIIYKCECVLLVLTLLFLHFKFFLISFFRVCCEMRQAFFLRRLSPNHFSSHSRCTLPCCALKVYVFILYNSTNLSKR